MRNMTSEARTSFGLMALLAPVLPDDFFRDHWERKPLHLSRDDVHYYDCVLTNQDLEVIISSTDLRYPAIQLARNGAYLAPEAYTKNIKHGSEFFNGVPDIAQIQSEYRSGSTVVLPAMQRTWAPLRELCEALENDFSHPVHAWRVFEPPLTLPHRTQPFTPMGYVLPAAPILELELKQGDLLYLPRGYVHAAHTSQRHSAHVTIGITVYTWVELLSELVGASKELADFRTALPPGFAADDDIKKSLKEGLFRCIRVLQDQGDGDRVIENFLERVRSARVRPGGVFQSDARVIGLQTRLKTPDTSRYRISMEARGTILEFEGRKFALPDKIRVTVNDMCKRKLFRPGDLSGPLDNDGKLRLARYLHGEHFLTLVD
jgi:hypothetical protein